jgi:hypothetical protein
MPAGVLAQHFDAQIRRPAKDLYSIAGLLFIGEFRNWTHEEAADAFMFNIDVQYELNLQPENQSLCRRTIERLFFWDRQNLLHDDGVSNLRSRDRRDRQRYSGELTFRRPSKSPIMLGYDAHRISN